MPLAAQPSPEFRKDSGCGLQGRLRSAPGRAREWPASRVRLGGWPSQPPRSRQGGISTLSLSISTGATNPKSRIERARALSWRGECWRGLSALSKRAAIGTVSITRSGLFSMASSFQVSECEKSFNCTIVSDGRAGLLGDYLGPVRMDAASSAHATHGSIRVWSGKRTLTSPSSKISMGVKTSRPGLT